MDYHDLYLKAIQFIVQLEYKKTVAEDMVKQLEYNNDILRMAGEEILKQRNEAYRILQGSGQMGGFFEGDSH